MDSLAEFIGKFMRKKKPAKGYETAREMKRRDKRKRGPS